MRIRSPERNDRLYSSNVYLLLGDWSRIEDVNTLVDVGADPAVLPFIEAASTGVGKRRVELVLLTHRHYDHVVMLDAVRDAYSPTVAAWGPCADGVDLTLADGERIRVADDVVEVIHAPAHTDDSVCFYGVRARALFVGDSPVIIQSDEHAYGEAFADALARMASRPVDAIYFGHGDPLTDRCNERLARSLEHLRHATGGREP